jgi:hypothetical protein
MKRNARFAVCVETWPEIAKLGDGDAARVENSEG